MVRQVGAEVSRRYVTSLSDYQVQFIISKIGYGISMTPRNLAMRDGIRELLQFELDHRQSTRRLMRKRVRK